jgi:hypothetical protein
MSKVGRWSTAAGSNNATPPNGWPEGQLPSTVNDCAREMMASIRTALIDPQFFDQDMTPTYITASSFSVPGNQTSAIQIGRRLKLFDATAGVQQIVYATVLSVSFTAVTTVQIEADSGSLTSSLSSFGLSIISNTNNALPRQSDLTVSTIAVTGGLSISGVAALNGPVAMGSTLSVSGAASFNGTLSVSATAFAAVFAAQNTAKAFTSFIVTAGGVSAGAVFNVSSISRSAVGVVRINFSASFADANYVMALSIEGSVTMASRSAVAGSCKFSLYSIAAPAPTDDVRIQAVFYHT